MGKLTARQMLAVWELRHSVVLWNSDPKDYRCDNSDELRRRHLGRTLRAGDLVLMHDNHPFAADVLPVLAAQVRANGLTFATVDKWIGAPGKTLSLVDDNR